jgi:hypothetical protein
MRSGIDDFPNAFPRYASLISYYWGYPYGRLVMPHTALSIIPECVPRYSIPIDQPQRDVETFLFRVFYTRVW